MAQANDRDERGESANPAANPAAAAQPNPPGSGGGPATGAGTGSGAVRPRPTPERGEWLADLAGGLVHEIKNPLSTMAINLALLQEDFERPTGGEPSPRDARVVKRVRTLQREVQRLEAIAQSFLEFARGGEVNRRPRDLARIVQEVLDFVEPENQRAGIRQHVDLEIGLPMVMVDETQIKQALINLLINARQAMPDGGELLVRVQRVGTLAEVSITDTGTGMRPDQLERCFDVYWSDKKGGTGLGLPTTRRIVEEHGGSIRVLSEVGRGTSFAFTLPLAVELTRQRPAKESAL